MNSIKQTGSDQQQPDTTAHSDRVPIIVIGSGVAGYTFIREFRKSQNDYPVVLITASAGAFYPKPQLSAALSQKKTAEQLIVKTPVQLAEELNIEIRTHQSVFSIDPQLSQITLETESLPYSKLVLAIGAQPRAVADPLDSLNSLSINQLEDYRTFRQKLPEATGVSIIGTGLVGCEFAYDLAKSGHDVQLWGREDRILQSLLPEKASHAVELALIDEGVTIHKGSKSLSVFLEKAREPGQLCLSAIGLEVNTRLAESAGLDVHKGICVDDQMLTRQANIYALGDCAEIAGTLYQYIQPITAQARVLAKVLSGQDTHARWQDEHWPVSIKVPGFPTLFRPPENQPGQWTVSGEGLDLKMVFTNTAGQLSGAVLMGQAVKERASILNALKQQQSINNSNL